MDNINFSKVAVGCPVVLWQPKESFDPEPETFYLTCQKLEVNVDAYLNTAIVKIVGEWLNEDTQAAECVFALPTTGTVSSVQVSVSSKDCVLLSAVIGNQQLAEHIEAHPIDDLSAKTEDVKTERKPQTPVESINRSTIDYMPGLFRLAVGEVQGGDVLTIVVEYMESLPYEKGRGYCLRLPLTFNKESIADDSQWADVVSVSGQVPVVADIGGVCNSHALKAQAMGQFKLFKVAETKPWMQSSDVSRFGRDFDLRFRRTDDSSQIGIHALKCSSFAADDPKTRVALFLTPPQKTESATPRCIYFVLDRSCAMAGQPFAEATRAVGLMLSHVAENDSFNVAIFDDGFQSWAQIAMLGISDNKQLCQQWLHGFSTTPATANVENGLKQALSAFEFQTLQPFIVLITASAVSNGRDICSMVAASKARVFTLSIGSFCDSFFLNALARVSRGYSEVMRKASQMSSRIRGFVQKFDAPLLTDISVALRGIGDGDDDVKEDFLKMDAEKVECYSTCVRDVYAAAPVSVVFEVAADEPRVQQLVVSGIDYNGERVELTCDVPLRQELVIDWMVARRKLEYLATDCWLLDFEASAQLKASTVSVTHSIPFASLSTLVCFQMDRGKAHTASLLSPDLESTLRFEDGAGVKMTKRLSIGSQDSEENEELNELFKRVNPAFAAAAASTGTLVIVPTSGVLSGTCQLTEETILTTALKDADSLNATPEVTDSGKKRVGCCQYCFHCGCCLSFFVVGGCRESRDLAEGAFECCDEGCLTSVCEMGGFLCCLCELFCKK